MSQVMGMFTQLVSSFVGAGNAEGIEQLAAVIERGQEGVAAAEEEWDEQEFHDADDGAVQMRVSAANAIVCAWRRFRWRREWRRARAATVIASAWWRCIRRGSSVLRAEGSQGTFARRQQLTIAKREEELLMFRSASPLEVQIAAKAAAADISLWRVELEDREADLERQIELAQKVHGTAHEGFREFQASWGRLLRESPCAELICDGCEARIRAGSTVVSIVGSGVDLCVECVKEWPHCEDFPVKNVAPGGVSTLFSILKAVPAMAVQRGIWRKSPAHDLGADSGVESPMPQVAVSRRPADWHWASPEPEAFEATDIGPPDPPTSRGIPSQQTAASVSGDQTHDGPQSGSQHDGPQPGSQHGGPQSGSQQAKEKKRVKRARQKAKRRAAAAAASSPSSPSHAPR